MARNKVSKLEKSQKEVLQKEKPLETMEDPSEKLANLKSLNALLVKETFERREQIDGLLKSKENLESEIISSAMDKKRLEVEKKLLEDQTVAAEIQRSLTLVFVSEQLNQQEEILKDQIRRESEELKCQLDDRNIGFIQLSNDYRTYRDAVLKDLDLKEKEADLLRSVVVDLEKSNVGAQEEIGRMRMECDRVVEEKAEMERRFDDLKREMVDAVKQRNEIEQAKIEQDLVVSKLQKEVDLLNIDLSHERGAFEGALREGDEIQTKLSIQVEVAERLKFKLLELMKSNLMIQEELSQLKSEREGLVEEIKERNRTLESLMMEKASIERSLSDSSKLIEDLKGERREIVREKEAIEHERANQVMKITELQKEVYQLSATISTLQREEEGLQSKVSELGKSNAHALEKHEQLRLEFGVLVEEKKERERNFELLMEEKNSTMRSLEEILLQLEDQKRKVDEVVNQKAEIEQEKIKQEVEIVELHKEISNLKVAVSTLQEACRDHVETNNTLQSEAGHYRDALESVTIERDNVRKELDLKKKEEVSLRSEVFELEKGITETKQELEQLKMEQGNLFEEKKEIASRVELLTEDKASLQMSLVEAEEGIEDLQAKMKAAERQAEQAFLMLKNIAKIVCRSDGAEGGKGNLAINAEKIGEELQPFATELEAIKRAFKNREGKVEDMMRKIEILKISVVEAQKKKNFWTWLSSATTIFAAASLAYVTRGR